MLRLQGISKTYGANLILKDMSLTAAAGQRLGLVGANGAGKSTLLKVAAGEVEPDSGTIALDPDETLGYLPQIMTGIEYQTLDSMIRDSLAELREIEARMRALETAMAVPAGDVSGALDEYGDLADQFERRGGYDLDHRIDLVIEGLGIAHLPRDQQMSTLSGGEKTRAALAALLLRQPDVLLLDEPTNHLDAAALEWLEGYLAAYPGAAVIVSHDREFLNRTVNVIIEIDEFSHESKRYTGDYDAYRRAKTLERAAWEEMFWAEQDEIKLLRRAMKTTARQVGHNKPFTGGDRMAYDAKGARVEHQVSRNIRNAEERLRRIEENPTPRPPLPLTIRTAFDPHALNNRIALVVSNVSKRYGDRVILDGVNFTLTHGERAVIVAPNGAGKTTLARIIAGDEHADSGEVITAGSAAIGYLDQEGSAMLSDRTVLETYRTFPNVSPDEEIAKAELMRFGLFTYPDLLKRVSDLSAGQRRKLQLARLIAARANLLILDEPTNHLSFDALEAFESALDDFDGAVLAVSHDRRFIERIRSHPRGQCWKLEQGKLAVL